MFDKRKVTILENLLSEREKIIKQLEEENKNKEKELQDKATEIQNMLKDHEDVVKSLDELKDIIATTKEKSIEYDRLVKEIKCMRDKYEKDMKKFMSKQK